MKLSTERILATHVGSLPRPDDVVELLLTRERGEPYDAASLDARIRQAVGEVVTQQVDCGIDVVSDGETSKISFHTYVKDRLTGFDFVEETAPGQGDGQRRMAADIIPYPEFREMMSGRTRQAPQFPRPSCVSPIAVKDRELLRKDIENHLAAVKASGATEGFMTAASPGTIVHAFGPNQYYPSDEAYVGALADAMRDEYKAIADAGLIVQIDCPDLAMVRHMTLKHLSDGDFLKRAEMHVEAMNHALSNVPAESARMHICWGNYEGPHDHDIGLDQVLGIILKGKPSGIQFEASNPRHAHEWTVWRDNAIPDDKVLIPGVLDTTTNFVEHPELVAQRIERYTDIVGRDRVIAGTDCGFGTFAGAGRVDSKIAFAKLRALGEGAAIASGRLW